MGASASMARGGCASFRAGLGDERVRLIDTYIATGNNRSGNLFAMLSTGASPTYGDGSNNHLAGAYTDLIYSGSAINTNKGVYGRHGNCPNTEAIYREQYAGSEILLNTLPLSGTNEYALTSAVPKNRLLGISPYGGNLQTGISVGGIRLKISGNKYTLEEAVNANLIEPLVLTGSTEDNGNYFFPNFHLVYEGGTSGTGDFPQGNILLKTKAEITHVEMNTNKSWTANIYGDGLYCELFAVGKDISLTPFGVRANLRLNQ